MAKIKGKIKTSTIRQIYEAQEHTPTLDMQRTQIVEVKANVDFN